jgi:predicted nucleic acid-binding protein
MSPAGHRSVVYDSGALIAIDSQRNRLAADWHRRFLETDQKIFVPTVVAAQVVRKPATQAGLMAALRGCKLIPFTTDHHLPVGRLLAAAGTSDVVDAFVALLAAREQALVVSADPGDIERLLDCLEVRMPVIPV